MAIGNAIVSVPLGMKFGGIGCALGTAIAMIVGNGFIMNWYYQTHIGLDMIYFWKQILRIVPAMLPAVVLGVIAVNLHAFTGYSGVLTFAVPYVYPALIVPFSETVATFVLSEENVIVSVSNSGIICIDGNTVA